MRRVQPLGNVVLILSPEKHALLGMFELLCVLNILSKIGVEI